MKVSNGLIEKFGVDKIIHGLVGMPILVVCIVASVFLFGMSLLSVLGGIVLGTAVTYLAGRWKESKDDVPDTIDIRATMRDTYLVVSVTLLMWSIIWTVKLLF